MCLQFLPCDFVSLVLQATGGGLAAHAHRQEHFGYDLTVGTNVMIAGLSFQAFTMFVFSLLGGIFARRAIHDQNRQRKRQEEEDDPAEINQVELLCFGTNFPGAFRCFLGSLAFSTVLIFARSIYRVAELSGGWTSSLMGNQTLFIIFEGVFVSLASISLVMFCPGWAAKPLMKYKEQEKENEKNRNRVQRDQMTIERVPTSDGRTQVQRVSTSSRRQDVPDPLPATAQLRIKPPTSGDVVTLNPSASTASPHTAA